MAGGEKKKESLHPDYTQIILILHHKNMTLTITGVDRKLLNGFIFRNCGHKGDKCDRNSCGTLTNQKDASLETFPYYLSPNDSISLVGRGV